MIIGFIQGIYHYILIKHSGLFDHDYYLKTYTDVRKAEIDPLWHFIRFGWKEGRNPSEVFNTRHYLLRYIDVRETDNNPLVHYIKFGKKEERSPNPALFSEWKNAIRNRPPINENAVYAQGVNVIGYLRTAKGIAEAARNNVRALQAVDIPYSVINYQVGMPSHQLTETFPNHKDSGKFLFNTNLFHINPPQMPDTIDVFNMKHLSEPYNIGVWYWELPQFPKDWLFAFDLIDEVWVASQFIKDSISSVSSKPVIKIPPCIDLEINHQKKRSDFYLPDNRFLFLCSFDVLSSQQRKNPRGAIQAFLKAFPENDHSTGLVVKIMNAEEAPNEVNDLENEFNHYSNIFFIKEFLDRKNMNTFINLIDTFVSLHRSEGFGLIPAEAMYLGKPVIMTNWSGNLEFMTPENSCGVNYRLVHLQKDYGIYKKGQIWADPDIEHASFFMQKLFNDPAYYQSISQNAQSHIRNNFSPKKIGQLIRNRLSELGLLNSNKNS